MGKEGLSNRLVRSTELSLALFLSEIAFDHESLERIKELDVPVIFAVTHLSDWDITAFINALGKQTSIRAKTVVASSHNWRDNPITAVGQVIAGRDNFLPISYGKGENREMGFFKRGNLNPMGKVMVEEDCSIIIAAFHDRSKVGFNQRGATLPEKGGGAAIYLAKTTGRPIVPVAVNMEGRLRGRAEIRVGKEIFIGEEERLRRGSNRMMQALSKMVPEEKRGAWSRDVKI